MLPPLELPSWSCPGWYAPGRDPIADFAVAAYDAHDAQLTKPRGALGLLEVIGRRLAAIHRATPPAARPAACLLFVSDHPVATHGVSAYPREVTRAMVANFEAGGAAASVLCRRAGLPLTIVDVGVDGGPVVGLGPAYRRADVASMPAGDLVVTDAMPAATYQAALAEGAAAVDRAGELRVLVIGEMGIGNSTCAAAVTAALLGAEGDELAALVGPGTGVAGLALDGKRAAIAAAVARVRATGPIDGHRAVQALGGRDLAATLGAMARAVEQRIAVIVDGYIAGAAALALCTIAPAAGAGLLFGHRSREPGHRRLLDALAARGGGDPLWARPLLELDMALGEGSGALLALGIVDAACALHAGMATFGEAAVPDRAGPGPG